MHIPDGYLSTKVWIATDLVAAPAVVLLARRAQAKFDHHRVPLLGVMGAFVFAAQMINFPAGNGTSSHLVGAALLGCLLGPSAAVIVMTAILATQALLFQDGGVLALGANIFNMAIAGVLAVLALSELLISGVAMPPAMLSLSFAWFLVSAAIEGALTMSVAVALERIQPGCLRKPEFAGRASVTTGAVALLLGAFGWLVASDHPDGLEALALRAGISGRITSLIASPFGDYQASFLADPWLSRPVAGLAGMVVIYIACLAISRGIGATSREGV